MKKLNRKGFTLIELLAIIVILAIIMVVTIPTVLDSLEDARRTTYQNAVNVVAEYAEKQYALARYGIPGADEVFKKICGDNGSLCDDSSEFEVDSINYPSASDLELQSAPELAYSFLEVAGAKISNFDGMYLKITNGRVCLRLYSSFLGDFANVKPINDIDGENGIYYLDKNLNNKYDDGRDGSLPEPVYMRSSGCE